MTRAEREKIEAEVRAQVEAERAAQRERIKALALMRLLTATLREHFGDALGHPREFARAIVAAFPGVAETIVLELAEQIYGPEEEEKKV